MQKYHTKIVMFEKVGASIRRSQGEPHDSALDHWRVAERARCLQNLLYPFWVCRQRHK